ncbi:MAG: 3-hydroxyacyl-ACP dehydratase FabZ [Candidatus Izemoplasmataceae bacterium]
MLNSNEIQKIIPHRYPFLLIDRIIELEVGKQVKALKNVTSSEPYFQGHFPNEHVMPGVLIIEALAQAGAVAILSDENHLGKTAYFAGIDKARFKRKVIPGDVLTLEVEITKMKGPIGKGTGRAFVEGELVCQAELLFAIGK